MANFGSSGVVRLWVCIATCRRPQGLRRLLKALAGQRFERSSMPEVTILVVNNDPGSNLAELRDDLGPGYPWSLAIVNEERRGIAHARNRALDETAGRADLITFIDDDEVPGETWLDELLAMRERAMADAVAGPVQPFYLEEPPRWLREGRFHEARQHRDGEVINYAYTNNVLVDRTTIERMRLRFDERLSLIGSEDLNFFTAFHAAGGRIVWASRARIVEWIPTSRMTLSWLLRRWYREGGADAALTSRRGTLLRGRAGMAAKGLLRIGLGSAAVLAMIPAAMVGRHSLCVARLKTVSRGCGMIGCALGHHYHEYNQIHGT